MRVAPPRPLPRPRCPWVSGTVHSDSARHLALSRRTARCRAGPGGTSSSISRTPSAPSRRCLPALQHRDRGHWRSAAERAEDHDRRRLHDEEASTGGTALPVGSATGAGRRGRLTGHGTKRHNETQSSATAGTSDQCEEGDSAARPHNSTSIVFHLSALPPLAGGRSGHASLGGRAGTVTGSSSGSPSVPVRGFVIGCGRGALGATILGAHGPARLRSLRTSRLARRPGIWQIRLVASGTSVRSGGTSVTALLRPTCRPPTPERGT